MITLDSPGRSQVAHTSNPVYQIRFPFTSHSATYATGNERMMSDWQPVSPSLHFKSLYLADGLAWCLTPLLRTEYEMYPGHGRYGDLPLQGEIPRAEPGIEPGTSWLVVRSSYHQATRGWSVNVVKCRSVQATDDNLMHTDCTLNT
jgi:hypothetical protein